MKLFLSTCAFVALLVAPAHGVVVEVPVPGLVGTYVDEYRMAVVQLPALPSVIHGVSVRVVGSTQFASYSCDGPGGYGPAQPVPTQINVEMLASPGTCATGRNLDAPGAFDWTQPVEPLFGATWAFLLDGSGEIGLGGHGFPPIFECVLVGPENWIAIESVTLLVDGDFATPARPASWGKLKSVYR